MDVFRIYNGRRTQRQTYYDRMGILNKTSLKVVCASDGLSDICTSENLKENSLKFQLNP